MRQFDEVIGLANLRVFHLNDSNKGLGSHVDRHAHIGEGEIGKGCVRVLVGRSAVCEDLRGCWRRSTGTTVWT